MWNVFWVYYILKSTYSRRQWRILKSEANTWKSHNHSRMSVKYMQYTQKWVYCSYQFDFSRDFVNLISYNGKTHVNHENKQYDAEILVSFQIFYLVNRHLLKKIVHVCQAAKKYTWCTVHAMSLHTYKMCASHLNFRTAL